MELLGQCLGPLGLQLKWACGIRQCIFNNRAADGKGEHHVADESSIFYPSGISTGLEYGLLTLSSSRTMFTANSPPKYAYQRGLTQSNSFGLHIGAATLDYPGSLTFGDYDRGRVIGPVISYSSRGDAIIQLLDIVIGTEVGDSAFVGFTKQSNLLVSRNQTVAPTLSTDPPSISLYQPTAGRHQCNRQQASSPIRSWILFVEHRRPGMYEDRNVIGLPWLRFSGRL